MSDLETGRRTALQRDVGASLGLPGARLEVAQSLSTSDVAAVMALCAEAADTDGVRPLSEHVTLHLRLGGEGPDRHLLVRSADGEVLGYAHLDPTDVVAGPAAEVVVHPGLRGHGIGRLLVEATLEQASPAGAASGGRVRLWAHGDHPAARALASSMGFTEGRRLEQWRRSLFSPLPALELPEGIRLRAFRPGDDDEAWLALNAKAFASHPEQGAWTLTDLRARMAESWFDPEGFLIAQDDDGMVAFHWTKVHGATIHEPAHGRPHAHDPIGEVYVVGVDPAVQGRGLGRAITLAGLHRLRAQGLPQAMLYVEGDNAAAQSVYHALGFTHWDTDVMFYRR